MGQATIDLPDPMQNPAPSGGPSADDLLAQLAGEEIDRLLAEADIERPSAPEPAFIQPPSATPLHPPDHPAQKPLTAATPRAGTVALAPSAKDPDTAAQAATEPQPEPEPQPPAKAQSAQSDVDELDSRVAKELDNLFTELTAGDPPATPSPPHAVAPQLAAPQPATPSLAATLAATTAAPSPHAAAPPPPAAPPPSPALPLDPVAQANELQKQVMGKSLLAAFSGPADAPATASHRKWPNLSFLLRPLEWLNAPLSACSDVVRESLGKVAIMTLINALAILLYVLFLRKH
jgi:hypothetical protein